MDLIRRPEKYLVRNIGEKDFFTDHWGVAVGTVNYTGNIFVNKGGEFYSLPEFFEVPLEDCPRAVKGPLCDICGWKLTLHAGGYVCLQCES